MFQVPGNGNLLAYSADKGEKLLEIKTNKNGAALPITYMIDGKQYVAFMAGAGKPAQQVGPTDAKVDNPPMLFAFELGGTAELPAPPVPGPGQFGGPGRGRGGATPPPPEQELHGVGKLLDTASAD